MENYNTILYDFYNVTMIGRLCYIFMCIERYLVTLYPERDWTPVAKRMWQWTENYWDDARDIYSVAVPEFIMEFDTYEETKEREYEGELEKYDYDEMIKLLKGITDGKGNDELCKILIFPIEFGNACEGACISYAEPKVIALIEKVETILQNYNIPLPDKAVFQHFIYDRSKPIKRGEKEPGWGDFENTEYLSIILRK